MMIVEHLVVDIHDHSHTVALNGSNTQLEFDAELGELESDQNGNVRRSSETSRGSSAAQVISAAKRKAVPFTFGLVLHGLADGCALGVSALEDSSSKGTKNLSFIVFLALLFHKGLWVFVQLIPILMSFCCSTDVYGILCISLEHEPSSRGV